MSTVHADVLGEDEFIIRALRRIGLLTVTIDSGTFSIDIDLRSQLCRPPGNRLPAGFETAAGGDRRPDQPRSGELGRWRGVRR